MRQAISLLNLPIAAASGAITAYRGVGFDDAQATVQGQKVKGIANRGAADTKTTDVTVKGTATAESGAAVAVGDRLIVDALGRVIKASALAAGIGTLAAAIGTLAADKGTLTVDAGAVAVTSTAANGDILVGAPGLSGAPALAGAPALTGSTLPEFEFATALEAAAGAGEFIEILMD